MIYRCIDFETTGLPGDDATTGLMQVGWCDLLSTAGLTLTPVSFLVDSGIPVSIPARAVHHISDEMVAGEMDPTAACVALMENGHEDGDFFCAHNVDHEKHYFSGGSRKWVCTYKTTLRLWPEAPGHKLNELRYWLDLDAAEDFNPKLADPPHRAPADAYVCAHLLRRILRDLPEGVDVDRLVKWSSGPALLYMCFMKKHKNRPWADVARDDREYLEWIFNVSDVKDRDIRATVKYWLNRTATTT